MHVPFGCAPNGTSDMWVQAVVAENRMTEFNLNTSGQLFQSDYLLHEFKDEIIVLRRKLDALQREITKL